MASVNYISILTGTHRHIFRYPSKPTLDHDDTFGRVIIGDNSFIGEHPMIMADIGQPSIEGTGSIVVSPVPDMLVAVGNPAKAVKKRYSNTLDRVIRKP